MGPRNDTGVVKHIIVAVVGAIRAVAARPHDVVPHGLSALRALYGVTPTRQTSDDGIIVLDDKAGLEVRRVERLRGVGAEPDPHATCTYGGRTGGAREGQDAILYGHIVIHVFPFVVAHQTYNFIQSFLKHQKRK